MTITSKILWPRPALAGCVFCTMVRDTRGVALDQNQRFNFFPASPLCSLSWTFAGDGYLIDRPEQMQRPWIAATMPRLAFSGTWPRPVVSWNSGESHLMTVAFYPDAFVAMTGLDLSPFTGRMVPADEALPRSILDPSHALFDAVEREGVETGFAAFAEVIERVWTGTRPAGFRPMRWTKDWARGLVLRAALTGLGRSPRQIARRVRSWTGVSERDLQGLVHTEQLYARLHEALDSDDVDWAELAATSGFADQAHMIRQMRRHTGFTPEQLRRRVASDEALWSYRLLGEYFDQPQGR
jgi:AraC-like DNA-binding protein